MPAPRLLIRLLADPHVAPALTPAEWDRVIPYAFRRGLLGRIDHAVCSAGVFAALPPAIARHLVAGRVQAQDRARMLRWEADRVRRALAGLGIPLVLLKGAAYELAELPPAHGRLASDLDLLVPRAALATVERRLLQHGWQHVKLDDYDQRYYREWMHELPPLHHPLRGTSIDVHHTILPLTGRRQPDATALLNAARPLPGTVFSVLAPADMVLHSAAHAFQDGDLGNVLRDLVDLDALLTHFIATEAGFVDALVARARALDLARPAWYALHTCRRLLDSPIPPHALAALAGAPPAPVRWTMDRLLDAVTFETPWHPLAGQLLYGRSHWLRMPPAMLAGHLGRKAWRRLQTSRAG